MLEILICDDEKEITDELYPMIHHFMKRKGLEHHINVFHDGIDTLNNIKKQKYDILFLDIDIDGTSGIEVAKKARTLYPYAQIVFISHYIEYQKYVFSIHTFDYILKPFKSQDILKVLDDLYVWIEKNNQVSIRELFKTKEGIIGLDVDKIIYFECKQRKIHIVCEDCTYEVNGKIGDIAKKMQPYDFFVPHKSFVINMKHIQKFYYQQGMMTMSNGCIIPLSQLKAKQFKACYLSLTSLMKERN